MTKYDGMKKVETSVKRNGCVEKKRKSAGDLFFRLLAAVFITAVPFCIKALPHSFAKKTVVAVKRAVTYDVISGEPVSSLQIKAYEQVKELLGNLKDDEN